MNETQYNHASMGSVLEITEVRYGCIGVKHGNLEFGVTGDMIDMERSSKLGKDKHYEIY